MTKISNEHEINSLKQKKMNLEKLMQKFKVFKKKKKDKKEIFDLTKKYETRKKEISNENIQTLKELSIHEEKIKSKEKPKKKIIKKIWQ